MIYGRYFGTNARAVTWKSGASAPRQWPQSMRALAPEVGLSLHLVIPKVVLWPEESAADWPLNERGEGVAA